MHIKNFKKIFSRTPKSSIGLQSKRGFTIIELIISLTILGAITYVISTFQTDVFSLNTNLQNNLNAQLDARHLIKQMVAELRKTTQSSIGSYAIESASSTAIVFYSDVNNNGSVDRVRYFTSGSTVKKGVVTPSGNPLSYNLNSEVVTTLVSDLVSSSTLPVFQYYPSTYEGTSSPMTYPLSIQSVRLVKITLIIDRDPNRSPVPIVVTSQVSLRNLKDNL